MSSDIYKRYPKAKSKLCKLADKTMKSKLLMVRRCDCNVNSAAFGQPMFRVSPTADYKQVMQNWERKYSLNFESSIYMVGIRSAQTPINHHHHSNGACQQIWSSSGYLRSRSMHRMKSFHNPFWWSRSQHWHWLCSKIELCFKTRQNCAGELISLFVVLNYFCSSAFNW